MLSLSLCRAHHCYHLGPTFRRRRLLSFHARGGQLMNTSFKNRFLINSILGHRIFRSFDGRIGISIFPTCTLMTTICATQRQLIASQQFVIDSLSTPSLEGEGTTFSSHALANPHLLLNPKDFLIEVFQKHGVHNVGESFHVISLKHRRKIWYTATFTDPVTNELFSSGLERRTFLGKQRRMKAMNGKVYCHDPTLAEHAAAARAIDCYIFRESSARTIAIESQLCLESPYNKIAETDIFPTNDDDTNTFHYTNKLQISRMAPFLPQLLITPCRLLHTIFGMMNYDSTKTMKSHRRIHHDGEVWFTATFTDPITAETFPSGLVVTEVNWQETETALPLHLARAMHVDGIVYYREVSLAEQAAAARAIDCYVYREETAVGSTNRTDGIRLCIEQPMLSSDDESPPIDYDAIIRTRNTKITTGDEDVIEIESRDGLNDEEEHQQTDNIAISALDDKLFDVETGDDVFPLPTKSLDDPINGVRKLHNLSTMGRILEIWTDTSGFNEDTSGDDITSESHLHSENDSPSAKIKSILDWCERVFSNPRTKAELSALTCCKLLVTLGKANVEQCGKKDASQVSVEKDAKKILDRIISLTHTSRFHDVETINAYLNCLDRSNPKNSAIYAEELLQCMREQTEHKRMKGISLPLPNVETYNAVMNLWALVDSSDGQQAVNRVFSLLEAASLGGEELSSRPNRTTFKTIISVNSKVDGQFSFEQAKSWLLKIKEASESISGESFTPDLDIFTAALRSQSMSSDFKDIDSQHSTSWLRYGDPYIGGFKSGDEHSNRVATDIAQWILYAEEFGVNPNTEMYDTVIRAWIKTGTRDGLIMAEDWAKRAVSSGSSTHLETFHPIIASWALCQFDRAPARVKEWIHQLTGLSTTMPHLKPDLNTLSAQIIAWVNVQTGIITKANQSKKSSSSSHVRLNNISVESSLQTSEERKVPQDVDMVFVAAQNCTEQLQTVFSTGTKIDQPQDIEAVISMVVSTIQTWGCATQFSILHPATSSASLDTLNGVHEMLNVAKLVKDRSDSEGNTNDDDDDEKRAYFNFQLLGQTYVEIISQLHQVDSALKSSATKEHATSSSSYFSREIAHVERMLNEFDLYSKKISPQDNFSYADTALRHRLYREILTGCTKLTSPSDYGHVMRLCKLIMDQLLWQDANCCYDERGNNGNGRNSHERNHHRPPNISDLFVDMALLTGTIVPIPQERTYILTTMWQNAKPFFRRKFDRRTYATVNQARLIGSMRMAMGGWEATESFIRQFDEWRLPTRRSVRGNTWLAFVQDLMKKSTT